MTTTYQELRQYLDDESIPFADKLARIDELADRGELPEVPEPQARELNPAAVAWLARYDAQIAREARNFEAHGEEAVYDMSAPTKHPVE